MSDWNSKISKERHESIMKFSELGQLCWRCANACGGCSWSKSFEPVTGWTADPVSVFNHAGEVDSYRIYDCPEFVPDGRSKNG